RRSDHPNSGAPDGGDTGSVVSVHGTVSARGAFAATGLRPLLAQEPLGGGGPVVDALIDLLAEVFVEVVGQVLAGLAEPGGPIDRGGAPGLLAEGLERGDADEDEHDTERQRRHQRSCLQYVEPTGDEESDGDGAL